MRNIFKIASLLFAAVMLFACEKTPSGNEGGELRIVSDKDVIQANGTDAATLKVMLGEKDVTAESVFYNENHEQLNVSNGQFTVTVVGEHRIYADYGTMSTYNKTIDGNGLFIIKAINVPVPVIVDDPEPANTSFAHRALLIQYTGTACPNCPRMTQLIRDIKAGGIIPAKAVHTAVHSYTAADPMYIPNPSAMSYPYLTIDNVQGFNENGGKPLLEQLIDEHSQGPAKAGISVSPMYYEDEKTLVVKVAVKAAEEGVYNVGAWLLEDGIYAQQSGTTDKSFNEHENCVRIADSRYYDSSTNTVTFFGHLLGNISAGQVVEKTFVMNLKNKWVVENMHMAVFVSRAMPVSQDYPYGYVVCNAVDVPINAPTPFEYVK